MEKVTPTSPNIPGLENKETLSELTGTKKSMQHGSPKVNELIQIAHYLQEMEAQENMGRVG